MSNRVEASPAVDVDVTTHGEFPGAADYAQAKIGGLSRLARRPVTYARVRLTRRHDPAVERPVIAQANLEVGGFLVRAQVEAVTAREAVDELEARLRRRLKHLAERWDAPRGPDAAPPWRHEEKAQRSPRALERTAPEPRLVRRKSYAMAPCTVDEAVTEMELLDYDFHLFTESGSGTAAVIYRSGPTGYRLALVAPALAGEVTPYRELVTISPHPLPCLREQDALERLALLDLPFLFFVDAAQGRASVLYRRFDGDYGLLTPAGAP
ncbi:HPF/RaiA family ribosome-associated protein [Mycobacterium sp. SMC-8]|uniref:ribosome hibernation promotion factor n=1 Tax=Mycobacterium sp. SMC-8 TaxID=2857060 RepID=UPI0021B1FB15|nr:HPF/RaiA family ribosome-associated protein [Mycobacterium sp. SMC-8]UXA14693.1 HPF/RaiA family ribosome-associated protein [Mycobacterium sp. SMC-8]